MNLHPYEYVYYNGLAGGIEGTYRRFELDYWCAASREAVQHLNDIAARGAVIGINKDSDQLVSYARKDLVIIGDIDTTERAKQLDLGYMVVCTRANSDPTLLPGRAIAGQVERNGVPLITIKQVK